MRALMVLSAMLFATWLPAQALAFAPSTNTSVSTPWQSPNLAAPRSAAINGTPAHRHAREEGKNPEKVASCQSFHPQQRCHGKQVNRSGNGNGNGNG